MVPSFSTSQTSLGSSPFTKQPVADIAFGLSLPNWVCASPIVGPRLDAKTRVANNFIQDPSILFLQKDVISSAGSSQTTDWSSIRSLLTALPFYLGRNSLL